MLQVHAPPFVTKENPSDGQGHAPSFSRAQKRRSFLKKKGRPAVSSSNETKTTTDDQSVPKDIDLIALPQLCFPGEAFWTFSNILEEHFSSVHGDDGISWFFSLVRWVESSPWESRGLLSLPGFHRRLWEPDTWSGGSVLQTHTGESYCSQTAWVKYLPLCTQIWNGKIAQYYLYVILFQTKRFQWIN